MASGPIHTQAVLAAIEADENEGGCMTCRSQTDAGDAESPPYEVPSWSPTSQPTA